MFELIANNDDLFCLEGEDDCKDLPNDSGLFYNNEIVDHFNNREVSSSDFDLGHTFTNLSGGVARLGVLCNSRYKYDGVTGIGDGGWIRNEQFDLIVAHEMGHQLWAGHSCK
jgi:hypothetical protein